MSLKTLTAIWDAPPCSGGDLLCLLAIADNSDENGYAWPSIGTIARKAAMSERGAQKCIRRLIDAGLIKVEIGGGRGKSNAYQITTNGIGDADQHKNHEQNSVNTVQGFDAVNPEQYDTNPEQSRHKPRTPVHPNPIEPPKEQERKNSKKKKSSPEEILARVVSLGMAKNFVAHRREIKKPLSCRSAVAMANKIQDHPNPDAVLNESIANGWQGVFPDKVKIAPPFRPNYVDAGAFGMLPEFK